MTVRAVIIKKGVPFQFIAERSDRGYVEFECIRFAETANYRPVVVQKFAERLLPLQRELVRLQQSRPATEPAPEAGGNSM